MRDGKKKRSKKFLADKRNYLEQLKSFEKKYSDTKTDAEVLQVSMERNTLIDEVDGKYCGGNMRWSVYGAISSTFDWHYQAMARLNATRNWRGSDSAALARELKKQEKRRKLYIEEQTKKEEQVDMDRRVYGDKFETFDEGFKNAKTWEEVCKIRDGLDVLMSEIKSRYSGMELWFELRIPIDATIRFWHDAMKRVSQDQRTVQKIYDEERENFSRLRSEAFRLYYERKKEDQFQRYGEQFERDKSFYWKKLAGFEKRYKGAETLEEVDVIERERMAIVDEILARYPDRRLYQALQLVLNSIRITEDLNMTRVTGNPEWAGKRR